MKELIQHVDYVQWEVTKKTKLAAELKEEQKKGRMEDCMFVRYATEKEDEGHEKEVSDKTVADLVSISDQLKCKKVVFYPYVHLLYGSQPSEPKTAIDIQNKVADGLREKGFEVKLSPFGWYKQFEMKCKGHPLSEWSRVIRASGEPSLQKKDVEKQDVSQAIKAEVDMKSHSHFYILEPTGKKHEIHIEDNKLKGFDFSKYPKLEKLCLYELAKNRVVDKAPPHVELMKKLELVDHEPGSDPGNLRFYPNGRLVKSLLEEFVTREVVEYGGMEIEAPIMYDYEQPQLKKYLNRFPARQYIVTTPNKNCFLRFAACFGQFLMLHDATVSYKNLPLRMYEMTRYSFRTEKRGELAGLRRLRAFTMPDCHAFCADIPSAVKEMQVRQKLAKNIMDGIGLSIKDDMELSLRIVNEYNKELAPMLEFLLKEWKKPVLIEEWDKRFFYYVFKIEWNFIDALDKAACLTTDQIDVENAETYDLSYTDTAGQKKRPVILHLSPSGSIERVMYALLEKAYMQGNPASKPAGEQASKNTAQKSMLPLWVSPTQVRVCPVADNHLKACEKIAEQLAEAQIRVDIDDRTETVGKKISKAEHDWIPYTLVIGDNEVEKGGAPGRGGAGAQKTQKIPVRVRENSKMEEMSLEGLIKEIKKKTEGMPFKKLSVPREISKRPKFVGQ